MAKKAKKPAQSGTPALQVLQESAIEYELFEYEHSATMEHGYARDTASVLGIAPEAVFKTLLVEADGQPAVGIVPASNLLNLKRIAKALGAKSAQMMDPAKAERLTGYVTGGISPLGQRKLYPTVIDETALLLDQILISGGKRTLSVKLRPADLAAVIKARFADIAE
ncbi:MAG: Cys-tRNA(Pro) deacylase [Actinomycetaceae bacterium]|nr:Cys-tRNA(Pro) deacylase [Actinomycetaceae bacterium]